MYWLKLKPENKPKNALVGIPTSDDINLRHIVEEANSIIVSDDVMDDDKNCATTNVSCIECRHRPTRGRRMLGPVKLAGGCLILRVLYAGCVAVDDFGA